MSTEGTKFIKPREIADLLKLHVLTIYGYIRQGKLRAVKFGKNYRVDEKDLELFIRQHKVMKIKEPNL